MSSAPGAIAQAAAVARRHAGREIALNPLVLAGLLLIVPLILVAVFAPAIAPHLPTDQFAAGLDADGMPVGPCPEFPLGTDNLGRDVFSRLVYGARVSLTVGIVAMVTATAIGVLVGLLAGYYGRWVDVLLMRFTDVMMTIPALLLALALAGLMDEKVVSLHPSWLHAPWLDLKLERGYATVLLVIGLVSWTYTARVVRGQVLSLKEREFVEGARAIGCSHARIMWRHILPNVLPAIVVLSAMSTAGTITMEAGLSYLGVGIPPPAPSWGGMISDGQSYLVVAPWLVLPPGLAVVAAVVAFNLLGQGLQDVLDPYHKRR
jgi:ABC-type dipeptide/oligopeptide/nickel transport system permease subunit